MTNDTWLKREIFEKHTFVINDLAADCRYLIFISVFNMIRNININIKYSIIIGKIFNI